MVTRLSKFISLLSIILILISCKNDAQKRTVEIQNIEKKKQKTDFFNKKYFHGFLMSVDESTPAEHPFYSYLNCKEEGYFAIHFIPKNKNLISFWKNKYFEENKYEYDDLITENRIINQLLDGKYNLYNIFCFQITNKYLDYSNGCTEESINLKTNAIADIYLYNPNTKQWDFQKKIKVDRLPPQADNKFFLDNFPSIITYVNEDKPKSNSTKSEIAINGENIFHIDNNKLIIREDLLNKINNNSNIDHGKDASLLNSYVLGLLSKRKAKEQLSFNDENLYKIIAYTINIVDPIYYKYFDEKDIFWGKYSFGDSRGGASLSEALVLSKLLSTQDLDNMILQFRKNNYYNLENLKVMLEKTSWFEP